MIQRGVLHAKPAAYNSFVPIFNVSNTKFDQVLRFANIFPIHIFRGCVIRLSVPSIGSTNHIHLLDYGIWKDEHSTPVRAYAKEDHRHQLNTYCIR